MFIYTVAGVLNALSLLYQVKRLVRVVFLRYCGEPADRVRNRPQLGRVYRYTYREMTGGGRQVSNMFMSFENHFITSDAGKKSKVKKKKNYNN